MSFPRWDQRKFLENLQPFKEEGKEHDLVEERNYSKISKCHKNAEIVCVYRESLWS